MRSRREMGRGGDARFHRLGLPAAAAHRLQRGENEIRVRIRFSLSFYTTGLYLWAMLDHGLG